MAELDQYSPEVEKLMNSNPTSREELLTDIQAFADFAIIAITELKQKDKTAKMYLGILDTLAGSAKTLLRMKAGRADQFSKETGVNWLLRNLCHMLGEGLQTASPETITKGGLAFQEIGRRLMGAVANEHQDKTE